MRGSTYRLALDKAILYLIASGKCHIYMTAKDKDEQITIKRDKEFESRLLRMQVWFIKRQDEQFKKCKEALIRLQPWMIKLYNAPPPSMNQIKEKFKQIILEQEAAQQVEIDLLNDQIDKLRESGK